MKVLLFVFNKLGVPLSPTKTLGHVTELEYLGIILDSVKMEARLPIEKVRRIALLLQSFLRRSRVQSETF